MKIYQEKSEIQMQGIARSKEFGFKLTSETFQMFFKNIYKRPILAVVRELCCNARDAHMLANNLMTEKFTMHLPNVLEPWFEVRDYGVGLSQEQMETLYSTFFESSKQASNDFIGGLGIGSKSPLAYADMFSATSFYNGKKYSYIITKNEVDVPTWAFVGEEDTDEPNGLCVNVPVKADNRADLSEFKAASQRALCYFENIPQINGEEITIEVPSYSARHNSWGVRSNSPASFDGLVAVMGNIAYPIDFDSLRLNQNDAKEYEGILFTHLYGSRYNFENIDLFFDIGSLSITPSREELQYDERTVKAILAKFKEVQKEFIQRCTSIIDQAPSYLDACFIFKKFSNTQRAVLTKNKVQYKGKDLALEFEFKKHIPVHTIDVDEELNGVKTGVKLKVNKANFDVRHIDLHQMMHNYNVNKGFPFTEKSGWSSSLSIDRQKPIFIVKDERSGNIIPKVLPYMRDNYWNGTVPSNVAYEERYICGIIFPIGSNKTKAEMKKDIDAMLKNMGINGSSAVKVLFLSDLVEDAKMVSARKATSSLGATYPIKEINIKPFYQKLVTSTNPADILTSVSSYPNSVDSSVDTRKDTDKVYMEMSTTSNPYIGGFSYYDTYLYHLLYMLGLDQLIVVPPQRMTQNIRNNWTPLSKYLDDNKDKVVKIASKLNATINVSTESCFNHLKKEVWYLCFPSLKKAGITHPVLTDVQVYMESVQTLVSKSSNSQAAAFIKFLGKHGVIRDALVAKNIILPSVDIKSDDAAITQMLIDTNAPTSVVNFIKSQSWFFPLLDDDLYRGYNTEHRIKQRKADWEKLLHKLLD